MLFPGSSKNKLDFFEHIECQVTLLIQVLVSLHLSVGPSHGWSGHYAGKLLERVIILFIFEALISERFEAFEVALVLKLNSIKPKILKHDFKFGFIEYSSFCLIPVYQLSESFNFVCESESSSNSCLKDLKNHLLFSAFQVLLFWLNDNDSLKAIEQFTVVEDTFLFV